MRASWGTPTRILLALFVAVVAGSCVTDRTTVRANDNRTPAGTMRGDTLQLRLVVRTAEWYPGADNGSHISVTTFAEEGKAPRIPGPLIRVEEGTPIAVTLRNDLADSTIRVVGLATASSRADSGLTLAPGESRELRFTAGAPGTYLYRAIVGVPDENIERETSSGAFVIDPVGGSPPDRIFVMNIWSDEPDSLSYREALAVNGRSFPHNEQTTEILGDSVRWRWINASGRGHPMHLHGFYFRVDGKGDGFADTTYAREARRLVVTESMNPFSTMQIVWQPHRIGNWLFHCHIGFHVSPEAQLDVPGDHAHWSADFGEHMAGLVVAMVVVPPPGHVEPDEGPPRRLDLYVQEGEPRHRSPRALGYILAEKGAPPPPRDSVEIPGRVLVLTRGVPTDVTIHNRLPRPTAVHWHGLELESYSDGMAGWSGIGKRIAPPIAAADSFTARLSLPRAGTFMYHTHLNDHEQLTSGLYGALLVLEPDETYDPETDHVYVIGWDGQQAPPHILLNGDSLPPPVSFGFGVEHRLRFVNIGMAIRFEFSIVRDSTVQTWRALAFDGADLPLSQATLQPAQTILDVGQTADVLFTPPRRGTYRLVVKNRNDRQHLEQLIIVR